jgi:hypothetical protein
MTAIMHWTMKGETANGINSAIPTELAALGRKLRRSRIAMLKSTAPEAKKR